jgi:hypothetical protein
MSSYRILNYSSGPSVREYTLTILYAVPFSSIPLHATSTIRFTNPVMFFSRDGQEIFLFQNRLDRFSGPSTGIGVSFPRMGRPEFGAVYFYSVTMLRLVGFMPPPEYTPSRLAQPDLTFILH